MIKTIRQLNCNSVIVNPNLLYLIFLFLLFSSCKKNIDNTSIVGQWQWAVTYPAGNPNSFPYYPLTPQNTGIEELMIFNADKTYLRYNNRALIDSGTYSTGHGTYTPYTGAYTFTYDSILYYHHAIPILGGVDYYQITKDTLAIIPGLADKYSGSYTFPQGGAKYLVKK